MSGDLGAALAVAVDFFAATGFDGSSGLISIAGLVSVEAFAFTLRLTFGVGVTLAAAFAFEIFVAGGLFLAAGFFGRFAVFEVFAPRLARLELARREIRPVVFFGFFIATVLAWVARLLVEIKPGISGAQREFGFCAVSAA